MTEKLPLSDRIEKMQEPEAYITIKDLKESFPNTTPCLLINPSKSSVNKISKVILDKIINHIQKETSASQWKSTSSLIEWFVKIDACRNQSKLLLQNLKRNDSLD